MIIIITFFVIGTLTYLYLRRLKFPKFFKNSSPSIAGVEIEDSDSTQSGEARSSSSIALMTSTVVPIDSKSYYPELTVQQW